MSRRSPGFRWRTLALASLVVLWLLLALAFAAHANAPDAGSRASSRHPLPSLPKAPSLELPKLEPGDVEQLEALLSKIRSEDEAVRQDAIREILEVPPRLVQAIDQRMNLIADSGSRDDMRRTLEAIRKRARDDEKDKLRAAGEKGKVTTPDYLKMVSEQAEPASKSWQDLISVLAMSRMLVQIGSVESARELVDVYVRFGEFLRVDTQLGLEKMGEKAVAAVIEARRHKAEKIARWAERQLDTLGKGIPSEAVQTSDHQVLADVLRAYGRVRDPDALRIVISFANSERAQVREAARQSVALMGEVSAWQLRDTYETIVGKKPPRDWSWERTARELFGEFDRLRLAQVYDLFERGDAARRKGDYVEMKRSFDKVLARSPLFERRSEMAEGYLEYAKSRLEQDRKEALDALRRARRIADRGELSVAAESLALTLEAEDLVDRGIADQVLLRRAVELDSTNLRARDMLGQIERGEMKKQGELERYAAAAAIGLVALAALLFIGLRRKAAKPSEAPAAAVPVSAPEADSEASPKLDEPGAVEPDEPAPVESNEPRDRSD